MSARTIGSLALVWVAGAKRQLLAWLHPPVLLLSVELLLLVLGSSCVGTSTACRSDACGAGVVIQAVKPTPITARALARPGQARLLVASTPTAPRCQVAITIDDGPYGPPYPGLTARMLQHLEQYHAHVTFFLIGHHLVLTGAEAPVLVKRMREDGDAIGNHSYSHAVESAYRTYPAWYGQPVIGLLADFAEADVALGRVLGEPGFHASLARLPGSQPLTHQALTHALEAQGRHVYGWDIDFDPPRGVAYTLPVVERVVSQKCAAQRQVIVLTHDWVFVRPGFGQLDALLSWLGHQGYATVALPFSNNP